MATTREPEGPDNWERQVRKGWLELAILATLWNDKVYGLEILRRLENDTDLVLAEGTIYPILARLKADGLVDTKWVEADSGHPRKYYWLTPAGRRRAIGMARYASGFLASIDTLIAPLLAKEEK
ncbi:MAG TPA: PadR family transcriptional regulator [Thermoanaerobaculia bacterium]|jgi:PadR family transcriptional regulator PadR|nr:PadR family transcriptional regulator [Thermoanaerobaculia bacterium]